MVSGIGVKDGCVGCRIDYEMVSGGYIEGLCIERSSCKTNKGKDTY